MATPGPEVGAALTSLGPNVARYTKQIAAELAAFGEVRRSVHGAGGQWRQRIYNAARRAGLRVTVTKEGDEFVGRVLEDEPDEGT